MEIAPNPLDSRIVCRIVWLETDRANEAELHCKRINNCGGGRPLGREIDEPLVHELVDIEMGDHIARVA